MRIMVERRRSPGRKKLVVLLAGVVLGLSGVEGAVRVRQYLKYGTTARTFYELTKDPDTGLTIPRPGHVVGPIRVNSLGFRGPELERPKPAGRVRVAFLGGSTTFCAEASSEEMTWPQGVVSGLAERFPDVTFDAVNAGVAGYSTVQSLLNLRRRVSPLEPDVIVIYHATNDLTRDTRALAVDRGLVRSAASDEESWLERHSLAWHLVRKNLTWHQRQNGGADGGLEFEPAELAAGFRGRLEELVRASHEIAPVVVLVTFSHRARRAQTPAERLAACSSSLYYMPYMSVAGLLAGFEEYNRAIRETALETGALLVEGEETIPADGTHFQDSVHFRDPGLALQAERVLVGLLKSGEVERLVERARAGG